MGVTVWWRTCKWAAKRFPGWGTKHLGRRWGLGASSVRASRKGRPLPAPWMAKVLGLRAHGMVLQKQVSIYVKWCVCAVVTLVRGTQRGGRTGVEGPGLSRWQRGMYGAGSIFLRYAWARADQVRLLGQGRPRLCRQHVA